MSYARFGGWGGSDVYVFANCDGFYECFACSITDGLAHFLCETPGEMIAHLEAHRERGQCVPQDCLDELKAEQRGTSIFTGRLTLKRSRSR
jgi:hypothetical protein